MKLPVKVNFYHNLRVRTHTFFLLHLNVGIEQPLGAIKTKYAPSYQHHLEWPCHEIGWSGLLIVRLVNVISLRTC